MDKGVCERIDDRYTYDCFSVSDNRVAFWEFNPTSPMRVLNVNDMSVITLIPSAVPSMLSWWKDDIYICT
jgi:hypothetical protein